MIHLIVCTHSRHDLARGAVASVRRHASDELRVTVLDSSGTLTPWDSVRVEHISCRQYGAQVFARRQFSRPGELTVCIDDDVRLVADVCLSERYSGGWFKHLNGAMVMAWDEVASTVPTRRMSQWRMSSRCEALPDELCRYAAAANAEQIDRVWVHIDKGSMPPTPERDALIQYLDRGPGLGDYVSKTLSAIGITEERVSRLVGRPCGCGRRKAYLNEVGRRLGIG